MSATVKKTLIGNCYIENRKDGPCVVGFDDAYEPSCIIPEEAEWIGDYAFNRYYGMETVQFPDAMDYIGECAFYRCSSLRKVTLGKNIKTLHRYVFSECHQLTEADFSESQVEVLPEGIFDDCLKLHTLKLPKTLKKIAAHSLYRSPNIVSLELNEGLKVIEELNLEGLKKLTIINLPSTVIHIPNLAYSDHIKTVLLNKQQHERFAEYLPKEAKIIYKD